jgi:hypothetical protein
MAWQLLMHAGTALACASVREYTLGLMDLWPSLSVNLVRRFDPDRVTIEWRRR